MATRSFPLDQSNEVSRIVYLLGVGRRKDIRIVGSQRFRAYLQSVDYDCIQHITIPSFSDANLTRLTEDFQHMMERLIRSPDVIIGDIKIGEKDEWNAYNGQVIGNRVVYDKRRCITALNRLMCDGVLSPQEASKYRKILNKRTLTLEDHILLKENLNYHKIRFKPNQVLTGYVPLQNKTIWRLMDGFKRGITKVDVIAWIDGVGYREFTMIQYIKTPDGKTNINFTTRRAIAGIRTDAMESVATGSWWKVVKRVLALLRLKNKEKTPLYKGLLEILNGETGRFAQIVGDTDLLAYLVENESVMTDERVKASLDAMIDRLQKLPSIPEVWTPKITEKIQRLTASVSSGFGYREFREEIDNLRDYFEKILNTRTHRVLVDKDLITPIQNTLK